MLPLLSLLGSRKFLVYAGVFCGMMLIMAAIIIGAFMAGRWYAEGSQAKADNKRLIEDSVVYEQIDRRADNTGLAEFLLQTAIE